MKNYSHKLESTSSKPRKDMYIHSDALMCDSFAWSIIT